MTAISDAASQLIFAPGTFADQVAIVTGGGSGIGLATATELAPEASPQIRPNTARETA